MRKIVVLAVLAVFTLCGNSFAFFIDFEDGLEGAPINDILGVSFQDYNGYDSLYGDSRTGNYNTTSDDLGYGTGDYHHNGNLFLWAGTNADARGVIVDFTIDDGTWFQTGYSSNSVFYLDAYLTDGSMVSVNGSANTGSTMGFLNVTAAAGTFIDYIVLHDTGNYWLCDDMSGDASGVGVPEPATLLLLCSGLIGLAGVKKKFKKN